MAANDLCGDVWDRGVNWKPELNQDIEFTAEKQINGVVRNYALKKMEPAS